jgi:hypothetical protein
VTLKPYISKNAHHVVTYGTASTPSCRYAKKSKVVQGQGGKELLTIAWVQFPTETVVHEKDQIILPDGTTGPVVLVVSINDHVETPVCVDVYLGEGSI